MTHDEAFDIGWNSEQALADRICSKLPSNDEEAIDTAFIAAFQGLTERMLNFWQKEMLLDIVNEIAADHIDEEHVCGDCREELELSKVSKENRNKMH